MTRGRDMFAAFATPVAVWLLQALLVFDILPELSLANDFVRSGAPMFMYPVLSGIAAGLLGRPRSIPISGLAAALVVIAVLWEFMGAPVAVMALAAGLITAAVAWPLSRYVASRRMGKRQSGSDAEGP